MIAPAKSTNPTTSPSLRLDQRSAQRGNTQRWKIHSGIFHQNMHVHETFRSVLYTPVLASPKTICHCMFNIPCPISSSIAVATVQFFIRWIVLFRSRTAHAHKTWSQAFTTIPMGAHSLSEVLKCEPCSLPRCGI